jgi:hypothetical protein
VIGTKLMEFTMLVLLTLLLKLVAGATLALP